MRLVSFYDQPRIMRSNLFTQSLNRFVAVSCSEIYERTAFLIFYRLEQMRLMESWPYFVGQVGPLSHSGKVTDMGVGNYILKVYSPDPYVSHLFLQHSDKLITVKERVQTFSTFTFWTLMLTPPRTL
jgi:hypothetical protein